MAPSQEFYQPDQTTAGSSTHQTSTGDASLTTDGRLLSQSHQILNDDGLYPCRDHLYGHRTKIVISTYDKTLKFTS